METGWRWSISLLTVLGAWAAFSGIGIACLRLVRLRNQTPQSLLDASWIGWALTIVWLQIWHCFFPVNAAARVLYLLFGVAGIVSSLGVVSRLTGSRLKRVSWLAVGVLLAAWVSNHALRQPHVYDSGLYHLNAVRWSEQYAVVPGLANLHWRLGFNNSSHLYTALFDVGPLENRSHHVASGILIFMALLPALYGFIRAVGTRAASPVERYWAVLFVPAAIWAAASGYASSPSPDVPAFLLAMVIGGRLVSLFDERSAVSAAAAFSSIILLGAVAVTVKLSIAVFAVLACLAAWVAFWRQTEPARGMFARTSWVAFLLAAAAAVPWIFRGVVLTGWPAFPAPLFGASVDWAIPESTVRETALRIKAWARQPGVPPEQVLDGVAWFGVWLRQSLVSSVRTFTAPLVACAAGMVLLVVRWLRGYPPTWREAMLLAVPTGGLVYWFLGAPDPRFQGAQLWVLAALLITFACGLWPRRFVRILLFLELVLLVAFTVQPLRLIRSWKDPGPARKIEMVMKTTVSGLDVWVPKTGDQAWNSELPATPYFNPRLRLRVPGDVSKGFTKRPPAEVMP